MSQREASRTALATAYLRAAHQILDAKPFILDDPVAVQLLGEGAEQRIRAAAERYQTPEALTLRSYVVLRSRFAEDRLSTAVQRGVSQYVIVGAGFDTFALRQPQWASSLKVIEVDHLSSQVAKRSRIAEVGMQIPTNVVFADIDFERESLRDGLLRNGVTITKPTFFSWLGVTMYLTDAAIDATLRSMATFPEGSEVVLTFLQPPMRSPHASLTGPSRLAQRVAELDEPFVSYFDQAKLKAKLLAAGFSSVEFLTPEIAKSRYFQQGQSDLPLPKRTDIASALR
jgi:methyltransferase (TIGR00027 family)